MKRAATKWVDEAAMLAAFCVEARAHGYRTVPEHSGHDLLLVAGPDVAPDPERDRRFAYEPWFRCVEPGDVIAVEGKLHATPKLLRQALPPHRQRSPAFNEGEPSKQRAAADFYVVVIPGADSDFMEVAAALDIGIVVMRPAEGEKWNRKPDRVDRVVLHDSYRVIGHPRCVVTSLDVDMPAGCPAPRALTPWKIAAVRIALLNREVTEADFAGTPVRRRTFLDRGWMRLLRREGRSGVYALVDAPSRPDREYPEIAAAIVAQRV